MPFKIVETIEKNKPLLFIVPYKWESKCRLQYPKSSIFNKLVRDEKSVPKDDWLVAFCQVKRAGLSTYQQAEDELNDMLNNSDTDRGVHQQQPQSQAACSRRVEADFNRLAEHLVFKNPPTEIAMTHGSEDNNLMSSDHGTETVYQVVQSQDEEISTPLQLMVEPSNVEEMLNKIYENQQSMFHIQNIILDNLKKQSMKLASLSVQLDESFANHINTNWTETTVTTLAEAKNKGYSDVLHIKPIENVQMLEEFELVLSSNDKKEKLVQQYAILCSKSNGFGITCAYKLLDTLFTREFVCTCSWSGGSRGTEIKTGFKAYKNIINFFFHLVHNWDSTYSVTDNEMFFKNVFKNALKRKNAKQLKTSAKKLRTKKTKKTDVATGTKNQINQELEHHNDENQHSSDSPKSVENIAEADAYDIC